MYPFPRLAGAAVLGAALCLTAAAQEQAAGKDGLRALSYPELGRLVRSLEGKIVVVYFWSFG